MAYVILECENCTIPTKPAETWAEAVAKAQTDGWLTMKSRYGWSNYCPQCAARINQFMQEMKYGREEDDY